MQSDASAIPTPHGAMRIDQVGADDPIAATVNRWMRTYLSRPHPRLGREGPVCPYVPLALEQHAVWMTTIRSRGLDQAEIASVVADYREVFLGLGPAGGLDDELKTLLLLFPDVQREEAPVVIDGVQSHLKPHFVDAGLMLGQFHDMNIAPGIHNPAFHPLRSPIPMLVIRFMVELDLPFLRQERDPAPIRLRFLRSYLRHLGANLQPAMHTLVQDALARAEREIADGIPGLPA